MGIILKVVVAACLVFGFHYGIKQIVNNAVTAELGDGPQNPTITLDPETLRRAQELGRGYETNPATRTAIDSVHRAAVAGGDSQLRQMNRDAARLAMPPSPPHIPGIPR